MKARFYIEKRKDESGKLMVKERPVFMSVSFSGKRAIISTEIKVDFHGWDPELQRVKTNYPGSNATNVWLDTLSDTAVRAMGTFQNFEGDPGTEHFKKIFQELKPKFSSGFFDIFYLFMEAKSSQWSASTYRKVRTIYKHLREFEDQTDYRIFFNNLDASFLEKFTAFYTEKGNSKTTTYKAVNILVWFLNWATDHGYNVYRDYRNFYKLMGPSTAASRTHIYLHWEELMKVRDFSPINRRMERVRDLFCFMCFSGLRFTELQALKKEDVGGDEIIVRKKKRDVRRLPFNKYAREIHQAYENKYYLNDTAFPSISAITMNKYLRMIGEGIGLTREVITAPGDEVKVPFYKRLTAGIAVNTFIANALELEVPIEVISEFTGVRNDSRVRRIKMDLAREEMKKFDLK